MVPLRADGPGERARRLLARRKRVEHRAEVVPGRPAQVGADGTVVAEDRNREETERDPTSHPEFALARWAGQHLTPAQRAAATVYTSGEHCPMCAAAHGWAGLGRIVYATSSEQMTGWLAEWGVGPSPVLPLAVTEVVPGLTVAGPAPQLAAQVRELHRRFRSA